jgi:hypothetical protein
MTAARLAVFAGLACLVPVSAWLVGQAGVAADASPGDMVRTLRAALRGLWMAQAFAAVLMAPVLTGFRVSEEAAAILAFWLVPLPLLVILWAGGVPSGTLGLTAVLGLVVSAGLALPHRILGSMNPAFRAEARAGLTLVCAFALWHFREDWLALAGS